MGEATKDLLVRVREQGARETEQALNGVDKAADKVSEGSKSLGTRLAENKEKFSALGGAAFAATSALQAASGGLTQILAGAGAATGALSAMPGPLGGVAAGFTALLGVGATVSTMFQDTGKAAEEAKAKIEGLRKAYEDLQATLGKGFSISAAARMTEFQAEGKATSDRRAALLTEIQETQRLRKELAGQKDEMELESRRQDVEYSARQFSTRAKVADTLFGAADLKRDTRFGSDAIEKGLAEREAELRKQFDLLGRKELDLQAEMDAVTRAEGFRRAKPAQSKAEDNKSGDKPGKAEEESQYGDLAGMGQWIGGSVYRGVKGVAKSFIGSGEDEPGVFSRLSNIMEINAAEGNLDVLADLGETAYDAHLRAADAVDMEARALDDLKRSLLDYGTAQATTYASGAIMAGIYGESLKGVLNAQAESIVKESSMQVPRLLAIGFTELALGHPELATSAFTASGIWATVGGAAAGVTAATGGFKGGGGGSSGNSSVPEAARGVRDTGRDREAQSVVINLSLNGPAPYSLADQKRWSQTVERGVKMAQSQRGARI